MEKKEKFEKELSELLGRYNAYIVAHGRTRQLSVLFFGDDNNIVDKIKCFGFTEQGINGGK